MKNQDNETIYSGNINKQILFEYLKNLEREKGYSILFLNLDNFKYIYDAYGHQYGDEVLRLVNKKAVNEIGNTGKVFCFFRNEFVVVLNCVSAEEIATKVEVFINRLSENIFSIGNNKIPLKFSVGIYIPNPMNPESMEDIVRKADLAMLKAKKGGKSQFAFYDETMEGDLKKNLLTAGEMKTGLKNKEFYLNYQPIYDLKRKQVLEIEALLR